MLFGSSFGFYYLFFLFGSMWFENWNLAYWVYKTASLELLNSKVWYFTPLTIFKVGNMYVCMYVCMYDLHEKERERKHFQEVGKPFQVVVLFAVRIIHCLMFYVQPSFQILPVPYLFITIYICFPANKRAFRSRTG